MYATMGGFCVGYIPPRYTLNKGECFLSVQPPTFASGMGVILPSRTSALVTDKVVAAAPIESGQALFQFQATSNNLSPGNVSARFKKC